MAPPPLWSGNLRLSLVLIPVKLCPAVSTEKAISFRMIHAPSGAPIRYVKGVPTEHGFEAVPDEEIIKGYEHVKGQYVFLRPEEIEELKLEAKHTIDMVRFVDEAEIDPRYFEKPYYLVPDGEEAAEGYTVIRQALAATKKVAIGQLIMHGREHLIGIRTLGRGLLLSILRYGDEVRAAEPYFKAITAEANPQGVALAKELIKRESGPFEPDKMPDQYAAAVQEMLRAKIEQRAPEVTIEPEGKPAPEVINIMAALKQSIEAKSRAKVRDAVRKRMGKAKGKPVVVKRSSVRPSHSRTTHQRSPLPRSS
jgi:DNA end-binding protein Ku